MKPTLFRLLTLVAAVAVGVAVSFALASHDVSDQLIPSIRSQAATDGINYVRANSVVISVPADGEFYFGKRQIKLSEIDEVVTQSLSTIPCGQRVAYVKSAPNLRFETLAALVKEVKQAGIDRIEFVIDRKKVSTR